MTGIAITPIYAALAALMLVVLSVRVVRFRQARGIGIGVGDGGDKALTRRIRAHGNFVEYVPLALFLLLLVEADGASPWTMHAMGGALLVGRLLHAWSLDAHNGTGCVAGMALTFGVLIVGATRCLWQAVSGAIV